MLDAAFPPSPSQWIADMNAVNAKVGAIYIWGGFTNYSLAHVQAAIAAGKYVLPIVVPGNVGPYPHSVLTALFNYGITAGPVAIDIETGSLPSRAWDSNFDTFMRSNKFIPIEYGTQSRFGPWGGPYTDNDELWIASWLRTGTLNPIPALPTGDVALQFVDDIVINGHTYDASVINESIFAGQGVDMATPDDIFGILHDGSDAHPDAWIHQILEDVKNNHLGSIEARLTTLTGMLSRDDLMIQQVVAAVSDVHTGLAAIDGAIAAIGNIPPANLQPLQDSVNQTRDSLNKILVAFRNA